MEVYCTLCCDQWSPYFPISHFIFIAHSRESFRADGDINFHYKSSDKDTANTQQHYVTSERTISSRLSMKSGHSITPFTAINWWCHSECDNSFFLRLTRRRKCIKHSRNAFFPLSLCAFFHEYWSWIYTHIQCELDMLKLRSRWKRDSKACKRSTMIMMDHPRGAAAKIQTHFRSTTWRSRALAVDVVCGEDGRNKIINLESWHH